MSQVEPNTPSLKQGTSGTETIELGDSVVLTRDVYVESGLAFNEGDIVTVSKTVVPQGETRTRYVLFSSKLKTGVALWDEVLQKAPSVQSPMNKGTIKRQIVVEGDIIAFEAGEQVEIESVQPNPERPEYKYVVFSRTLNRRFQLSEADIAGADQDVSGTSTKSCPFCGEPILQVAIKCRYCGSDLTAPGSNSRSETGATSGIVAGIALIVPLCAALIIWLWIGNMTILESPSSKLAIVAILTVIITAIMIAVDANQLRMGAQDDVTEKGRKREGPVTWCVFVLLFWIIGFPAYYFRRERYGQRNYVAVAILVALIFLGTVAGFTWAIEKKKSDIRQMLNPPGSRIFIQQTIALTKPFRDTHDADEPYCICLLEHGPKS